MTRLQVAFLLPNLSARDGWLSHARGFIPAISQYVDAHLICSQNDFELAREVFPNNQLLSLPTVQDGYLRGRNLLPLLATLREILRCQWPQVHLVHSLEAFPTGLIGSWIARRLKKPHVVTAHGSYALVALRRRLDLAAYRHVLKTAAVLCTVSRGTAEMAKTHFPRVFDRLPLVSIPNGNNFYQVVPREEATQRILSPVPSILTVGAIKPRKGQELGLKAFALLKAWIPQCRYTLVGQPQDVSYYEKLKAFVKDRQLRDVTFLGKVSDQELREQYRQASVLLVPSQQVGLRFEGFGLVCLEAGAHGLPVVATRTGGIPEAVIDGQTGTLVDPGSPEEMARALHRILTDPSLARRMGLAGRKRAETLTWDLCACRQLAVYQSVAGAGAASLNKAAFGVG